MILTLCLVAIIIKNWEVHIRMSCKPKFSFRGRNLRMAAAQGGPCISGGGRSVPAQLRGVGSAPDLGEETELGEKREEQASP